MTRKQYRPPIVEYLYQYLTPEDLVQDKGKVQAALARKHTSAVVIAAPVRGGLWHLMAGKNPKSSLDRMEANEGIVGTPIIFEAHCKAPRSFTPPSTSQLKRAYAWILIVEKGLRVSAQSMYIGYGQCTHTGLVDCEGELIQPQPGLFL